MSEQDAGDERVRRAYENGTQTFMGVTLLVDPGALVPREETEILGTTAERTIKGMNIAAPRIIDMCCGSGNLACALGVRIPEARVWASDLTDGCVSLARRNVDKLGLQGRVNVFQGDLFGSLAGEALENTIDAVVCNPPYISTGRLAADRANLLEQEPREAFDGGPYGLSIHQRVTKEAPKFLRAGGWLLFEFGLGQEKQVKILFDRAKAYTNVQFVPDSAGNPRVALGQKSG